MGCINNQLYGKPLAALSPARLLVYAFTRAGVARIVVVIPAGGEALAEAALAGLDVELVAGGATPKGT